MKKNYSINPYTGKPNSSNTLEGYVISHTNSLKVGQPMKHHNYNYTHDIHWQNSQNFISLLGQKEQEIKSHEKSYQTLSGTQKTEFINLIKSTALDPLKHELKNNYLNLMYIDLLKLV